MFGRGLAHVLEFASCETIMAMLPSAPTRSRSHASLLLLTLRIVGAKLEKLMLMLVQGYCLNMSKDLMLLIQTRSLLSD